MNEQRPERWYDERVEAYVDGDLPDREHRLFSARLAVDDGLRQAVDDALALQQAMATMPTYRCPRRVTRTVHEVTGTGWALPEWGWAAAASAAVLVLAVALWPGSVTQAPQAPEARELAQARHDLEVALAYLEHSSTLASREVGSQVIGTALLGPMTRGLQQGLPTNKDNHPTEDAS